MIATLASLLRLVRAIGALGLLRARHIMRAGFLLGVAVFVLCGRGNGGRGGDGGNGAGEAARR